MATIRKYLDLSTANIAQSDGTALEDAAKGISLDAEDVLPRVITHTYGWWMNVPEADDPNAETQRQAAYPNLHRVIEHAREHDCSWVNIDQDADVDPDLPTFDW